MNNLAEYKEKIHNCSKCGLCQSVCPIYKITGNDCTVSRGLFIMLKGLIKGKIKMTKNLNRYLDLCLKCGSCSKFCPSEIDVVEIITSAKQEYFKNNKFEKFKSFIQKTIIFDLGLNIIKIFSHKIKSKKFNQKVIYFGGCGTKLSGNNAVIKLLNSCNIEVITPDFQCCGIPFLVRGDANNFNKYKENFIDKIKQYNTNEIVTTCASCEKTLKSYGIKNLKIKNIYTYIKENNLKLELRKKTKITYHKPCNIDNFEDIKWVLNSTKNLEYIEMQGFDECCGLNGISKIKEYPIMSKIFMKKHNNIINSKVKIVTTSCLGCEFALKLFSFGKYRVFDLAKFINDNIKN